MNLDRIDKDQISLLFRLFIIVLLLGAENFILFLLVAKIGNNFPNLHIGVVASFFAGMFGYASLVLLIRKLFAL